MIIENQQKDFEVVETGRFLATIVDVVDLGKVKTVFQGKEKEDVKLRIVWVLDKNDSEGRPFRVLRQVNAKITDKPKKSNLYELVEQVTGTAPAFPFDTEVLIGKSNELTLVRETAANGKVYANVKAILPLPAGAVAPQAPVGFVRARDKNKVSVTSQAPANPAPAAQPAASAPVVDAAF